jgi:hypothetical protein
MPLLASLIGYIATGLTALLGRFFILSTALKYAAYGTWIIVMGTFLGTVYVCTSTLYSAATGMISSAGGVGGGLTSAFFMGLGMFIPANAGAVLACVSSVWIATSIYKVQKQGIFNFAK